MSNLKEAKQKYKVGDLFITATKNIRKPLKVAQLKEAEHEDRKNEILYLKDKCLSLYREFTPYKPKDKFENLEEDFKKEGTFKDKTKDILERLEYLLSLENDIVNTDGGVIFCGETLEWSELCQ
jgi:hypothetical protein|tara:strand:- start:178 stop:549 length:372 start_codon:yes stop_codon:yes gene_type:complete